MEFYLWAGRPTPSMVFSRRPIENFTRTKCYGISILHMQAKFQLSRFNNNKKVADWVVDPLMRLIAGLALSILASLFRLVVFDCCS